MPLELRAGIEKATTLNQDAIDNEEEGSLSDGHIYGCVVGKIRKAKICHIIGS